MAINYVPQRKENRATYTTVLIFTIVKMVTRA